MFWLDEDMNSLCFFLLKQLLMLNETFAIGRVVLIAIP